MPSWLPYALTWFASTALGGASVWGVIRGKLENHEQRIKAIEQELGTRDTGLRGAVHANTNALLRLDGRVTGLEDE